MQHALEHLVIVPRNGYVNRLQAWASAAILGAQLDVPVSVVWEPERIAPAEALDLISESEVRRSFWDVEQLTSLVGGAHQTLARYLTVDADRRLLVLAGHDRGEQAFMGELVDALADPCAPTSLVVIAGGKFRLDTHEDFDRQRRLFYERVPWQTEIVDAVAATTDGRPPYLGLHVRGTDRSREAPSARAVREALRQLKELGPTSLFVAADTEASRLCWTDEALRLGFEPWSRTEVNRDRRVVAEGVDAVIDWRILGMAQAIVHAASSSFGEEAAVCTAQASACIALTASPSRQRLRAAGEWATAAVTYPRRRWGSQQSPGDEAVREVVTTRPQ